MLTRFFIFCSILTLVAAPSFAAPVTSSGLPIPRFVALRSDEVNVRTGPGTRYPISWVYHKVSMPVEVVEEFDYWRKIRDAEGTTGWVHKTMLDGKRYAMITGKKAQVLRTEPEDDAKPILKAEPMVVGKIVECEKKWCRLQIDGRKGWLPKSTLWGVYADEVVE